MFAFYRIMLNAVFRLLIYGTDKKVFQPLFEPASWDCASYMGIK